MEISAIKAYGTIGQKNIIVKSQIRKGNGTTISEVCGQRPLSGRSIVRHALIRSDFYHTYYYNPLSVLIESDDYLAL